MRKITSYREQVRFPTMIFSSPRNPNHAVKFHEYPYIIQSARTEKRTKSTRIRHGGK
jgi:hypothetical protein